MGKNLGLMSPPCRIFIAAALFASLAFAQRAEWRSLPLAEFRSTQDCFASAETTVSETLEYSHWISPGTPSLIISIMDSGFRSHADALHTGVGSDAPDEVSIPRGPPPAFLLG